MLAKGGKCFLQAKTPQIMNANLMLMSAILMSKRRKKKGENDRRLSNRANSDRVRNSCHWQLYFQNNNFVKGACRERLEIV